MTKSFTIQMKKTGEMQFTTTFDKNFPELFFDEPESVTGGLDQYPNASRVLTAAVANCLSASFTFCTSKMRIPVKELDTTATCTIDRNKEGYSRIKNISVEIHPIFESEAEEKKQKRCVGIFRNYCVVSKSVEEGIDISVDIKI
jgi:uncharacterized OsmC-like protein